MKRSREILKEDLDEEINVEWTEDEKANIPSRYGCQILLEKCSLNQLKDPSFPSDAYIITYQLNGEKYMDLCRGSKVKIFDLYYDKFGPGCILKIDFGYGRVNPKIWGFKKKEGKKRK
jgi:hypothetical protein